MGLPNYNIRPYLSHGVENMFISFESQKCKSGGTFPDDAIKLHLVAKAASKAFCANLLLHKWNYVREVH